MAFPVLAKPLYSYPEWSYPFWPQNTGIPLYPQAVSTGHIGDRLAAGPIAGSQGASTHPACPYVVAHARCFPIALQLTAHGPLPGPRNA